MLAAAGDAASEGDNRRARMLADEVARNYGRSAIPLEVVNALRSYLDAASRF